MESPSAALATSFLEANQARNGWEMGHALLRRRLPAVRPLLFVETKFGDRDALVVEEIPGAVSWERCVLDRVSQLPVREAGFRLKDLSAAAGGELRKLHDHGFHQPNFSLRSLIVREEEAGIRLWFAGLESFKKLKHVDCRLAMQSFAHCLRTLPVDFPLRRSCCLRFLRSYLGSQFSKAWKTYWRGIAALGRDSQREAA